MKGTFYQCNGSLLSQEQMELVTYPIPFANFTDDQVAWLHQNASECGNNDNGWAEDYTPTSKELCLCLNSEWKTTITQNFDNVLRGFSLLFEISTTEGWVQVMVSDSVLLCMFGLQIPSNDIYYCFILFNEVRSHRPKRNRYAASKR